MADMAYHDTEQANAYGPPVTYGSPNAMAQPTRFGDVAAIQSGRARGALMDKLQSARGAPLSSADQETAIGEAGY